MGHNVNTKSNKLLSVFSSKSFKNEKGPNNDEVNGK